MVLEIVAATEVQAWVNGQPVGANEDGEAFVFLADITKETNSDANVLAIATVMQGIQGHVKIHILPPQHWEIGDPLVDAGDWQGGQVQPRIRTTIHNAANQSIDCVMKASVRSPNGELLAEGRSSVVLPANGSTPVLFKTDTIAAPPLWSPSNPQLCNVAVELRVDNHDIQSSEIPFGFRWFRFDPDNGFFLNRKKMELRGMTYPNQGPYADDGDTANPPLAFPSRGEMWDHEVGLLKGMGVNFVRLVGGVAYDLLDVCDRAGLLTTPGLEGGWRFKVVENDMLHHSRFAYNHACVLGWHFNGEGKNERDAKRISSGAEILRDHDPGLSLAINRNLNEINSLAVFYAQGNIGLNASFLH